MESMNGTIVIIGGGQAGAQAVDTLRRESYTQRLILIGAEPELPYQRPPLSKKFLSGELARERLWFRHRGFYDEHRVELVLGKSVTGIDPVARSVTVEDHPLLRYDRLLLCLGASSRRLTCEGADLAGVHHLRDLRDAYALQSEIRPGARVVIVGGGYIGLETAATCVKLGCKVKVLEMADRLMNRVVAPVVSTFFAAEHAKHGIEIFLDTRVAALAGRDRVESVVCADGTVHTADLVVVGVGAEARTDLARNAGLACDNGIVVDEFCRTSDAAIYAAGDCTNHPSPRYGRRLRLESVDNAFEQAKTASQNMLGGSVVHDRVPWFWSDQFDNKLLIVGLPQGADRTVVRGDPADRSFSVCHFAGRELLALEAVNHSKDYMAARKLIPERASLDPDRAQDPSVPLKEAI
jgi:3-phenylpropionate/trans-cinnamate dioxygenase ferredoxin reductase subunit